MVRNQKYIRTVECLLEPKLKKTLTALQNFGNHLSLDLLTVAAIFEFAALKTKVMENYQAIVVVCFTTKLLSI